jgi:hypothetical protein
VATFAKVERSTHQGYQNLRAQSEVEIRFEQKKAAGFPRNPAALSVRIVFRSIFDNYPLHHALLSWARVVNTYLLTSSQRGCHYFARSVNDSRSCAEREADRAFMTLDHDRFPRLVSGYGAG